ncbi:hypothetical protein GCM10017673_38730 [Streptosporangium violaceochromogenes]|nr:hypothetical protein GCM10017673_38730 [Streptosporangium violaceochromogenes]
MNRTRNDEAHLIHLMRLALTLSWMSRNPALDRRAAARHISRVQEIVARHCGDHTAYRALASDISTALAYLGRRAADCGFDCVRADFCTLRDLANTYLRSLTREQRVQLASFQGFDHAHLVEENTRPGGAGALVMWLNPVYDRTRNPDLAKVQAAAERRYAERYPDLQPV